MSPEFAQDFLHSARWGRSGCRSDWRGRSPSALSTGHSLVDMDEEQSGEKRIGAVSSAPWGSASILPISWMYIQMMGPTGSEAGKRSRYLECELYC